MLEQIATAISLMRECRDDEALQLLDAAAAVADPDDAALALMLKYALYAGDLKDWRRADETLSEAAKLVPEYAHYNEEAEGMVEGQPARFPKCRELAQLVSEIYAARYQTYRSR
jgi:hypothetical protein